LTATWGLVRYERTLLLGLRLFLTAPWGLVRYAREAPLLAPAPYYLTNEKENKC